MVVMAPKDENELQHMVKTAICSNSPIAFRYPRGVGYGVTLDPRLKRLEIGRAELLREGDDIVILAVGSTVIPSLEAAEKLEERGIHAAVVNSRFVKPLDGELLCDLGQKIGRVLTVEMSSTVDSEVQFWNFIRPAAFLL
jgi:1-deoxy-D-xylulose-5-phosphate synthase